MAVQCREGRTQSLLVFRSIHGRGFVLTDIVDWLVLQFSEFLDAFSSAPADERRPLRVPTHLGDSLRARHFASECKTGDNKRKLHLVFVCVRVACRLPTVSKGRSGRVVARSWPITETWGWMACTDCRAVGIISFFLNESIGRAEFGTETIAPCACMTKWLASRCQLYSVAD